MEDEDEGQFYWDAEAGELKLIKSSVSHEKITPATDTEPNDSQQGGDIGDGSSSGEEESSGKAQGGSSIFDQVSTPQLIESAIEAGGELEKSVSSLHKRRPKFLKTSI